MKIQYNDWITLLNSKLIEHNQSIRVIDYFKGTLTLSNGKTLQGSEFAQFKKRVMHKTTTEWVNSIDNLLDGTITEKEVKTRLARQGGIACQKKHGDAIRLNLNTGTPWNAGTKGQNVGTMQLRSQEVKDKISAKNSGIHNGMYGSKMSEAGKAFRSTLMKQKILEGKFTPNSNNRNTHWNTTFAGKKYRSSWEALYQYINPKAEYEILRIEYTLNNTRKIYIVDFVDHTTKQVVEVKPAELCTGDKFDAKFSALTNWAEENGYTVTLVTKEWLQDNIADTTIDYTQFDTITALKIKGIYETRKTNRNK